MEMEKDVNFTFPEKQSRLINGIHSKACFACKIQSFRILTVMQSMQSVTFTVWIWVSRACSLDGLNTIWKKTWLFNYLLFLMFSVSILLTLSLIDVLCDVQVGSLVEIGVFKHIH